MHTHAFALAGLACLPAVFLGAPSSPLASSSPVGASFSAVEAHQDPEWKAPSRASRKKNPLPDNAETLAKGKLVFTSQCVSCHGETGVGDGVAAKDLEKHPGNLTDPRIQEQSDGALFWKITNGRAPMTAFGTVISVEERWAVIRYVRTFADGKTPIVEPHFSVPADSRSLLGGLFDAYDGVRATLTAGSFEAARKALGTLDAAIAAIGGVDAAKLGDAAGAWKAAAASLAQAGAKLAKAGDIASLRSAFLAFTGSAETAWKQFGHSKNTPLFVFASKGARWVQSSKKPEDPRGATLPVGTEEAKLVQGITGTKTKGAGN